MWKLCIRREWNELAAGTVRELMTPLIMFEFVDFSHFLPFGGKRAKICHCQGSICRFQSGHQCFSKCITRIAMQYCKIMLIEATWKVLYVITMRIVDEILRGVDGHRYRSNCGHSMLEGFLVARLEFNYGLDPRHFIGKGIAGRNVHSHTKYRVWPKKWASNFQMKKAFFFGKSFNFLACK